jgi:multisubunit Na+/H+ antiporter MnhE subunit
MNNKIALTVVFVVCCWGAFQNLESSPKGILVGFIVIGVLFNPLIPFRFKRDIWQVIDVIAAIAIIATTFVMKNKTANSKN